jgi:tetratricopeptide (TPR) repeat protein
MHQSLANAAWAGKNSAEWQRQLLMAVANYDLALKADPRMSQAFYNLGMAQYQLNQKEKAYSDFALATSLVPRFMPAADYNQAVIGRDLKKSTPAPAATAPPCPIGPVGPAGPP